MIRFAYFLGQLVVPAAKMWIFGDDES